MFFRLNCTVTQKWNYGLPYIHMDPWKLFVSLSCLILTGIYFDCHFYMEINRWLFLTTSGIIIWESGHNQEKMSRRNLLKSNDQKLWTREHILSTWRNTVHFRGLVNEGKGKLRLLSLLSLLKIHFATIFQRFNISV